MQLHNTQENVLVVGGTGFIGFHLIKYLKKRKFKQITSISTKRPKLIRKIKNVKYICIDVSKKKKLNLLSKEYTYIINLSGYVDHSNKKLTFNSHYRGCKNLVEFFENTKIKSFVQVGSSLEYGKLTSPQQENKGLKPQSIYSKAKYMATKFLIKKNKIKKFPAVILRAYQVYGPKQDNNRLIPFVINSCMQNKNFNCSSGKQLRDFLHIDDFVKAIYKSMINKVAIGHIINIGYGRPLKVKKVILLIKNIIKQGKPQFNQIKLRQDETMVLYPSIKKAKKILNWKPKINFNYGIKKTILDYKKIYK